MNSFNSFIPETQEQQTLRLLFSLSNHGAVHHSPSMPQIYPLSIQASVDGNENFSTNMSLSDEHLLRRMQFDRTNHDSTAAVLADLEDEFFNFGDITAHDVAMSSDWDMLSSTQSESAQPTLFEANGIHIHDMYHYSDVVQDELVSSLTLPVSHKTQSNLKKAKTLRVVVKQQALSLIGAERVMTRSSDRTISKWILPHSPAPNALPRFQSGRFCYEVNWKRGGSDDLNIEFLGALVLAVQATQEKAVIRAPADLIMETAKAYLTTMRRNYVTQRANKENIVQKKSRTSKKCTSEKSNVEPHARPRPTRMYSRSKHASGRRICPRTSTCQAPRGCPYDARLPPHLLPLHHVPTPPSTCPARTHSSTRTFLHARIPARAHFLTPGPRRTVRPSALTRMPARLHVHARRPHTHIHQPPCPPAPTPSSPCAQDPIQGQLTAHDCPPAPTACAATTRAPTAHTPVSRCHHRERAELGRVSDVVRNPTDDLE
ncbi:hypothetical protein FIBSPDRAFT_958785 [Athelia psychrophila]|uniref:Uncharacterized protein n=1 Tax=Athelia psychrophila TaxID=1759441 RepID=A0A166E6Q5_9AGAM|nr:hypothetical protein FIBSPDRAFT_958785 [Fibularhizoctonia sp. CBS 109695]